MTHDQGHTAMTHAEQVLKAFENQTHTMSVKTCAKGFKPRHKKEYDWKIGGTIHTYEFPDGSYLYTRGRGLSHKIWATR